MLDIRGLFFRDFSHPWPERAFLELYMNRGHESTVNHERMEAIQAAITPQLRKQLLAFALKRLQGRCWTNDGDPVELAEDVASEAICKTVTGERLWKEAYLLDMGSRSMEPDLVQSLKKHLFLAAKSIISNRRKLNENRLKLQPIDQANAHDPEDQSENIGSSLLEAEEFLCALLIEMDGDDLCCNMLYLFNKGHSGTDVCDILRAGYEGQKPLTDDQINAAKKRLRRKTTSFIKTWNSLQ